MVHGIAGKSIFSENRHDFLAESWIGNSVYLFAVDARYRGTLAIEFEIGNPGSKGEENRAQGQIQRKGLKGANKKV